MDKVITRSKILEVLRKFKNENSEKYGINNLGLFGSYSKNEAKPESDIDIVIETFEPDLFKIVHIKEDLEKLLSKTVDIVRKRESMNPYLKKYIEKDSIYV
ncbi:MAG: nucleotidyltransferase [Calditrichaeota bacterium]|nr:MAG: nucleotidyltransferase [Calditrichota bacterium]